MARRQRQEPKTAPYVVLTDDVDDPIELIESSSAMRAALSRATQLTADIVIDLEQKQALYAFLKDRRREAVEALESLVDVDPTDAKAVYALQRRIHPYFDACRFIKESVAAGTEADETIEETYGHGAENPD